MQPPISETVTLNGTFSQAIVPRAVIPGHQLCQAVLAQFIPLIVSQDRANQG
jgi:hypothetical protein